MARNKAKQSNIDNSNLPAYPNARIKDNDGSDNGTPVNEAVYGDIHEAFAKLMRLYGIPYNDFPDNEVTGYQYIEALRALASKNDFILNIDSAVGKLTVPVKLGAMLDDEQIVCKVLVNKAAETQIKGSDGISRGITYVGDFKIGEYVRLINTSTTVVLIRMVDTANLDSAVGELSFLKAATYLEEIAGILDTVSTTPQTNALAFVERVNGAESDNALAMPSIRNGLLSKEDKQTLDDLSGLSNRYGTILIGNVGAYSVGVTRPVTGDLQTAVVASFTSQGSIWNVTITNPLLTSDYYLDISIESLGTMELDNDIKQIVWKKISNSQFQLYIEQDVVVTQNVKIHVNVIQK